MPLPPTHSRLRTHLPLVLILLLAALVRIPLLSMEFGRNGDGTGALYGIAARNYLARGLHNFQTGWMPILSSPTGPAAVPTLYAHHPPTVPLTLTLGTLLLGDKETGLRLMPALFTLALIPTVYFLILPRTNRLAAITGAALMAFNPLSLRFGQMPDVVNSQLVLTCALTLLSYLRWHERQAALPAGGNVPRTALPKPLSSVRGTQCFLLLALLTDWPAFYLAPILCLHLALTRPIHWKRLVVQLIALSTGTFAILYAWSSLATGNWLLIPHQFLNRAAQARSDTWQPITLAGWLSRTSGYNLDLHGLTLWALAALGLVMALFCRPHKPLRSLILLPAGWATIHVLVGHQAVYSHQWWWWPVTLALVVSAASVVTHFDRVPGITSSLEGAAQPTPKPRAVALPQFVVYIAIAGLCTYWTVSELRHLRSSPWRLGDIASYSPKDLGDAVSQSDTPPGTVLLFDQDEQPYLNYYVRRPLIQKVWDAPSFQAARSATKAHLFYTFEEPITPPPTLLVLPVAYESKSHLILPLLRGVYKETRTEKFLLFDLTRPSGQAL